MIKFTQLIFIAATLLLYTHTASAASLFLTPEHNNISTNTKFTVDVKINSETTGVNAAQATLRFPKETLSVVSIDKSHSAFSFWLEEPTYSNENGVITFIGGTPYGISGASIQVFTITFTTKGVGTAPLTISDAAITASDGSGTNILSTVANAEFTISPTATTPPVTTETPTPPQKINREPKPAEKLPAKPIVSIPAYSDSTKWYNKTGVFNVQWELPLDISNIATALNKEPSFTPKQSEGIFTEKSFLAPTDGVWFLHVRFKNNIGWSETTHYRIAIDTNPPHAFDITNNESDSDQNPVHKLQFNTTDALSGIEKYTLQADQETWEISAADFSGTYDLRSTKHGKHHVIVRAYDKAGNSIESTTEIEITPLPSPVISYITEKVFSDEPTGINIHGTGLPNTGILVSLKQRGTLISNSIVPTNEFGFWEYQYTDPLRSGAYNVVLQNRNDKGALSLEVTSSDITVTPKPIFQIGIFVVTERGIIITLTILIFAGIGSAWWYYKRRLTKIALRVNIAESDTAKVFSMLESDIEKLENAHKTTTPADDTFIIEKMRSTIKKMAPYVKKEIDKAKE